MNQSSCPQSLSQSALLGHLTKTRVFPRAASWRPWPLALRKPTPPTAEGTVHKGSHFSRVPLGSYPFSEAATPFSSTPIGATPPGGWHSLRPRPMLRRTLFSMARRRTAGVASVFWPLISWCVCSSWDTAGVSTTSSSESGNKAKNISRNPTLQSKADWRGSSRKETQTGESVWRGEGGGDRGYWYLVVFYGSLPGIDFTSVEIT